MYSPLICLSTVQTALIAAEVPTKSNSSPERTSITGEVRVNEPQNMPWPIAIQMAAIKRVRQYQLHLRTSPFRCWTHIFEQIGAWAHLFVDVKFRERNNENVTRLERRQLRITSKWIVKQELEPQNTFPALPPLVSTVSTDLHLCEWTVAFNISSTRFTVPSNGTANMLPVKWTEKSHWMQTQRAMY